jgi:outer membrane protein assembly factor BamB
MHNWLGILLAIWSGFRGPNGAGVDAESRGLPAEIGPDKYVVWKLALPAGSSSPVLTRDRIYLTGSEGGELLTIAIDRSSGRVLWRRPLAPPRSEERHKLNNAASATPVTDGVNVYAFFGDFGLAAYGPDGNELWRMPLGPFTNLHGMAASPILAGDRLILVCDQDTGSFMMAVDKRTGKQSWRVERPSVVHGFATPTLLGRDQIVVPGSYLLQSYSVKTGGELWSVRGLTWQIKSSAIAGGDGTIYVTGWAPGADGGQSKPLPPFETAAGEIDANRNGKLEADELNPSQYKHGGSWRAIDLDADGAIDPREWGFYRGRRAARNVTMAVRPGSSARGDLTGTHVLWRNEKSVPQVSSPLLYGGVLYTIKDGGILTSLDPATGAILKTARISGAIDAYYSSPVAADGKLYIGAEKGSLAVVKAGAQWEPLHVAAFDEGIYATPAIADGRIYLRTTQALYCFGNK